MIKEQPQETRICHDRESRNISRGKEWGRGAECEGGSALEQGSLL